MDPVSLAIGIPGLIQSCVHGYRFVGEMLSLDETAKVTCLRCRIEESRLHLWGRFWGLLDDDKARRIRIVEDIGSDFNDLLELPHMADLVCDVLTQILQTLEKGQLMSEQYGRTSGGSPSPGKLKGRKPGLRGALKWALKDKAVFEAMVENLTTLNDGLERLLPRRARARLETALVGQVFADERVAPGDEEAKALVQAFEAKGRGNGNAQGQQTDTCRIEAAPTSIVEDDRASREQPPNGKNDTVNQRLGGEEKESTKGPRSMQLQLAWFRGLQGSRTGRTMELLGLPEDYHARKAGLDEEQHTTPSVKLAQSQAQSSKSDRGKDLENTRIDPGVLPVVTHEELVLVEWRSYEETKDLSHIQMALDARRDQISRLFARGLSSGSNGEHYVLPCLGWVLLDELTMGLVFRPPPWVSGPPRTLHEVLQASFAADTNVAPDLDTRLQLASSLAMALYQLQCTGWLHRQVSSHNILFFSHVQANSRDGTEVDVVLSRPFLAGWQSSRRDDQVSQQKSEQTESFRAHRHMAREYPYMHPERPPKGPETRYRRSYDVHSLGVVLAEIAFWEPIGALDGYPDSHNSEGWNVLRGTPEALQEWSGKIYETCDRELGAEVGLQYKEAVLWCLRGVRAWLLNEFEASGFTTEKADLEREIGLEKAFFWNVVNRLDQVSMALGPLKSNY